MISISDIVFETKQFISDEDIEAFNDFDDFIKTNGDIYVDRMMKKRYAEFIVKPITVSDFKAVLPKYHEIVQVSGSDNEDVIRRYRHNWFVNSEVAAWIKKDYQDNIYTVIKNRDKCSTDECDTELIMNAALFHDELARGGSYSLIKKMYTDYDTDDKGCCKSAIDRQFNVMHPTESNTFGLVEQFTKESINFSCGNINGTKWDFDIRYSPTDKCKVMKTNFKEGVILLSYHGRVYDDEGFIMFPEDKPNFLLATRYFIQSMVFEKLANQYKTNDYNNVLARVKRDFLLYNNMAITELNDYSYNELAPIIARAKFHYNEEKTFDALTQRDHPDGFRQRLEDSYNY